MNTKLARVLLIFLLTGVGSFLGATHAYAAPRLTLDPISATVVKDATVQFNVLIDAEAIQVFGADAVLTYGTADFDVTSVGNGGFFPTFTYGNDATNGKLELHGYFSELFASKNGAGTYATVTFKAKKDTGTSPIGFACGNSGATTKILNTSNVNILSCSNLNSASITFSPPSSLPTNTPIPTATPLPTATSAPSTGNNLNPVCEGISVNRSSGNTPFTVTVTCSGSDADSDINYAEFNFDDGQQLSIEKNIGRSGSISVNHTYSIIGAYRASCRLRDSAGSFSSKPATCQTIVRVNKASASTTSSPKITATPIPTLGTQLVTLSTVTPTPPPESPTPIPTISQEPGFPTQFPWIWVSIGLVAAGLVILALGLKRNNPPTNPPSMPPPTWQSP